MSARLDKKKLPDKSRAEWFEHDRFGMFVTWGLYSPPAGISRLSPNS
jgi:hypothetical protein